MKTIFSLLLSALIAAPAMADSSTLIKSCQTSFTTPEERTAKIITEIYQENVGYSSVSKSIVNGQTYISKDNANVDLYDIRPGLNNGSINSDLNLGERFIVHAMIYSRDAGRNLDLGMDLDLVRKVKLYTIGKPGDLSAPGIVEAYAEYNTPLGSFLSGFLVGACEATN